MRGKYIYIKFNSLKEGHFLLNDALNTFYLWLYGTGHTVKDHSVRGNLPQLLISTIPQTGVFCGFISFFGVYYYLYIYFNLILCWIVHFHNHVTGEHTLYILYTSHGAPFRTGNRRELILDRYGMELIFNQWVRYTPSAPALGGQMTQTAAASQQSGSTHLNIMSTRFTSDPDL